MHEAPHLYARELIARGGSQRLVSKVRSIDQATASSEVEAIYTLGHLAAICGISYSSIGKLLTEFDDKYEIIQIPKRSSKPGSPEYREISIPCRDLSMVQRRILECCLTSPRISLNSYAYQRGKNTYSLVKNHLGSKTIFRFDLSDFFGSICVDKVFKVFLKFGYPRLLSYQLALLCTYSHGASMSKTRSAGEPLYKLENRGKLPQGAPTSGAISNYVLSHFDRILSSFALRLGAVYTRYADDFHLSFIGNMTLSQRASIINDVDRIVSHSGFKLNKSKTRVLSNQNAHNLLGLRIGENKISVNARYRKRILSFIRAINKYGSDSYSDFCNTNNAMLGKSDRFNSGYDVIARIYGHYCYIRGVDQEFADEIRADVRRIVSPLFSVAHE